jgi:hypothetical protein
MNIAFDENKQLKKEQTSTTNKNRKKRKSLKDF